MTLLDRIRFQKSIDETANEVMLPADAVTAVVSALQKIALGRGDCGRPIAAENARQLARNTLIDVGERWAIAANPKGRV